MQQFTLNPANVKTKTSLFYKVMSFKIKEN